MLKLITDDIWIRFFIHNIGFIKLYNYNIILTFNDLMLISIHLSDTRRSSSLSEYLIRMRDV